MTAGQTPFEQAVLGVLLALAPGDVVTYGEVAEEAGYPGRARAVGHLLARGPRPGPAPGGDAGSMPSQCRPSPTEAVRDGMVGVGEVPWWRVVAANGRLVPGLEAEHARRLRAEGVETGPDRVVGLAAIRRSQRSRRAPGVVSPALPKS